jgi:hypothetical protein
MKGRILTVFTAGTNGRCAKEDATRITPQLHTQNCGLSASKPHVFYELW